MVTSENEIQHNSLNLWDAAKAVLREKYIEIHIAYLNTCSLPQEARKISEKQSNLTPKGARKRTHEA